MYRSILLAATSAATAALAQSSSSNCFPYGTATVPTDLSAPNRSVKDWWCSQDQAYGFQGFSYPLEDSDCSAASNGYAAMNKDFARMKADFGASIVRVYYATCLSSSVFENAIRAAANNNMGVILQVWTNFGENDDWKKSQAAIYSAMEGKYKAIAPYVVHSADFGSEPVGDGMDGGGDQFVKDLGLFRKRMNSYGRPAGISEDWDRPGTMSVGGGDGLGDVGKGVLQNSDYAHAHIMPFYQGSLTEKQTWSYIQPRIEWLKKNVPLPTFITETQWAWGANSHYGGRKDVGLSQYKAYWKQFDDNCEYFKSVNVGWFLHAWYGEETFDIKYDNGSYVIPNWKPRRC